MSTITDLYVKTESSFSTQSRTASSEQWTKTCQCLEYRINWNSGPHQRKM